VAKALKISFTLLKVFLSGSIVLNLGSLKYPSEATNQLWWCLLEKVRTHFEQNPD